LINDWDGLLDVAGLGHSNNRAILDIEDTILLEDRAKHSLDNNTWAWVRDERGLLMQLLGEEVNTQVSVLASSRRGGNADDLARTALKDQEIPDANVVAGNGDSVGNGGRLGGGGASRCVFIVVTHVVSTFGGIDGFFGETNLCSLRLLVSRRIDSLFGDTNRLALTLLESGRVDGLLGEADFLFLLRTEAWWINSGTADTSFFLSVTWHELRRVYSGVDADFFTVAWLETRTILTFSKVDLCIVESATSTFNDVFDTVFNTVAKFSERVRKMWEVYFDAF